MAEEVERYYLQAKALKRAGEFGLRPEDVQPPQAKTTD